MPKKKTKKAAAKRCKLTASGRVKHARAGKSHLLGNKSRKRKRHMRRSRLIHASDEKRIKTLLV